MRGPGNGLTYPSCWTTATGQTEYIFDVTLADAGVLVRNATPARANGLEKFKSLCQGDAQIWGELGRQVSGDCR
jgi:hypothetical protein